MSQEPTLNDPGLQVCIALSSEFPGSRGKRKHRSLSEEAFFFSNRHLFIHSFIHSVSQMKSV